MAFRGTGDIENGRHIRVCGERAMNRSENTEIANWIETKKNVQYLHLVVCAIIVIVI